MTEDLIIIQFTEYELKWLRWALAEIITHPIWDYDYPTGKKLLERTFTALADYWRKENANRTTSL